MVGGLSPSQRVDVGRVRDAGHVEGVAVRRVAGAVTFQADGRTQPYTDGDSFGVVIRPLGLEEVDAGVRREGASYHRLSVDSGLTFVLGDRLRVGSTAMRVIKVQGDKTGVAAVTLVDCVEESE